MTDTTHGGNMPIIWKTLIIVPVIAVCVAAGAVGYVAASNTKISVYWQGKTFVNMTDPDAIETVEAEIKPVKPKKTRGPSSIHLDGVSQ